MADNPTPEDLAKAYESGRSGGDGIINDAINDLMYSDKEKEAELEGTKDKINAEIMKKESEEDDDDD